MNVSEPLVFTLPCPDITPWRAGNTGVEGVWQFDSGVPGPHVMLSALVHGNELCGAWALKGLLEAGVRHARGTLTLAFCNLAAFDRSTNELLPWRWEIETIPVAAPIPEPGSIVLLGLGGLVLAARARRARV